MSQPLTINQVYSATETPNLPRLANLQLESLITEGGSEHTVQFNYSMPQQYNQTYNFQQINAVHLNGDKHNVVDTIEQPPPLGFNGILHDNYNTTYNDAHNTPKPIELNCERDLEHPFSAYFRDPINRILKQPEINCSVSHRSVYRGMGLRYNQTPDYVVHEGTRINQGDVLIPIEFKLSFKVFASLLEDEFNHVENWNTITPEQVSQAHTALLQHLNQQNQRITMVQHGPLRKAIIQLIKYMIPASCRYGILHFYYFYMIVDIGCWPNPRSEWSDPIDINGHSPYVPIRLSIFYDGKYTTHAVTALVLKSPKLTNAGKNQLALHYIAYQEAQLNGTQSVQQLYNTMNEILRMPTGHVVDNPQGFIQQRIPATTPVASPSMQAQPSQRVSSPDVSPIKPSKPVNIDCSVLDVDGYDEMIFTNMINTFDEYTNSNQPYKSILSGHYNGTHVYIKVFNNIHSGGQIELNALALITDYRTDRTKTLYNDVQCVKLIAAKQSNDEWINHNFTGQQLQLYNLFRNKTVIITESVQMYQSLGNIQVFDKMSKSIIHEQLCSLIDKLNDCSIYYTDIHIGNVYYDSVKQSIHLIDFDTIRFTTEGYFFGDREIDHVTVMLEQRQCIDRLVYKRYLTETCELHCRAVELVYEKDNLLPQNLEALQRDIRAKAYKPPE